MRFAIAAFASVLLLPATAGATALNDYCSPHGGLCEGVQWDMPHVTLGIHSFSRTGNYQLCVRYRTARRYLCRSFSLGYEGSDRHGSTVRFQRHFPHAHHGRYYASWRQSGRVIGPPVAFQY